MDASIWLLWNSIAKYFFVNTRLSISVFPPLFYWRIDLRELRIVLFCLIGRA